MRLALPQHYCPGNGSQNATHRRLARACCISRSCSSRNDGLGDSSRRLMATSAPFHVPFTTCEPPGGATVGVQSKNGLTLQALHATQVLWPLHAARGCAAWLAGPH